MLAKLHSVERDASNHLHFVAPRKMAHGYFAGFDDFDDDPDRPLVEEFRRLAINRRWGKRESHTKESARSALHRNLGFISTTAKAILVVGKTCARICQSNQYRDPSRNVKGSVYVVDFCSDSTADINRRCRKNMSTLLILLNSEDVVCLRNCSHQRELFVDTPSKKGRSSASKRLRVTGIWLCY